MKQYIRDEWLPKRKIFWIVFDLSNGHQCANRYVWWFDTRQAAREHIKDQKTKKYAARLSVPRKVYFK